MSFPAENRRLLSPAEVDSLADKGACSFCERPPDGSRSHVAIDLGKASDGDRMPDGRPITVTTQLDGRTYSLRTGFGVRTHEVRFVVLCSACVEFAGQLMGIGPLAPERQLLDQEREQSARLARELAEAREQLESLTQQLPGLRAILEGAESKQPVPA